MCYTIQAKKKSVTLLNMNIKNYKFSNYRHLMLWMNTVINNKRNKKKPVYLPILILKFVQISESLMLLFGLYQ